MLQVLVDLILRAGWNYVSVVNTEGDKKIRVRFGASEGVSECSGLVLYSKCSLLEKL